MPIYGHTFRTADCPRPIPPTIARTSLPEAGTRRMIPPVALKLFVFSLSHGSLPIYASIVHARTPKVAWSATGSNENWYRQPNRSNFLNGLDMPQPRRRATRSAACGTPGPVRRMMASGTITGSRLIAGREEINMKHREVTTLLAPACPARGVGAATDRHLLTAIFTRSEMTDFVFAHIRRPPWGVMLRPSWLEAR
jgi:hypothetical protein